MNIRLGTLADIRAIQEVEQQCPSAAHWTEAQYQDLLQGKLESERPDRLVLLMEERSSNPAKSEPAVPAFLVAQHIDREWELENIAVVHAARRKGFATTLIHELLEHARQSEGESVFLEVRESNGVARALYEKLNFIEIGQRRAYYYNPTEDAILYRLTLT